MGLHLHENHLVPILNSIVWYEEWDLHPGAVPGSVANLVRASLGANHESGKVLAVGAALAVGLNLCLTEEKRPNYTGSFFLKKSLLVFYLNFQLNAAF